MAKNNKMEETIKMDANKKTKKKVPLGDLNLKVDSLRPVSKTIESIKASMASSSKKNGVAINNAVKRKNRSSVSGMEDLIIIMEKIEKGIRNNNKLLKNLIDLTTNNKKVKVRKTTIDIISKGTVVRKKTTTPVNSHDKVFDIAAPEALKRKQNKSARSKIAVVNSVEQKVIHKPKTLPTNEPKIFTSFCFIVYFKRTKDENRAIEKVDKVTNYINSYLRNKTFLCSINKDFERLPDFLPIELETYRKDAQNTTYFKFNLHSTSINDSNIERIIETIQEKLYKAEAKGWLKSFVFEL